MQYMYCVFLPKLNYCFLQMNIRAFQTASDIDMTELLDIYDYSEDEEDRQIAHIVLLELVVDRYKCALVLFACSPRLYCTFV